MSAVLYVLSVIYLSFGVGMGAAAWHIDGAYHRAVGKSLVWRIANSLAFVAFWPVFFIGAALTS